MTKTQLTLNTLALCCFATSTGMMVLEPLFNLRPLPPNPALARLPAPPATAYLPLDGLDFIRRYRPHSTPIFHFHWTPEPVCIVVGDMGFDGKPIEYDCSTVPDNCVVIEKAPKQLLEGPTPKIPYICLESPDVKRSRV